MGLPTRVGGRSMDDRVEVARPVYNKNVWPGVTSETCILCGLLLARLAIALPCLCAHVRPIEGLAELRCHVMGLAPSCACRCA